jgi:hypothetical protein
MTTELRKGKKVETFRGEMFQYHNVWLSPFPHYVLEKISEEVGLDEQIVISIIVEQSIESGIGLSADRIDYFKEVLIPKIEKRRAEEATL